MNAWAHPTRHATRQLDRSTHFHTTTQESPHWLQWDAANSPPKLPLPLRRSPPKSNTPLPSPTRLTIPNGITIHPHAVMLVLGLGLGLKAKFFGLGLGLGLETMSPWPWPWP